MRVDSYPYPFYRFVMGDDTDSADTAVRTSPLAKIGYLPPCARRVKM